MTINDVELKKLVKNKFCDKKDIPTRENASVMHLFVSCIYLTISSFPG